jgi:hypothetical protein
MTQTISLKDNYAIQLIPDTWDKHISVVLVDEVNNSNTTLGIWKGGKWSSDSPINMSKMFQIMKQYPKVKRMTRNVFQVLKNTPEPSKQITKTWSCFRRRVNVKIHNIVK